MRLKRSKLSEKQSARLLEHFVAGTPARTAADLAGVKQKLGGALLSPFARDNRGADRR